MNRVVAKYDLNSKVCRISIAAEAVARKVKPGQFIIVRLDEKAERIPLTVFSADPDKGTIDIIVQNAGKSTCRLCCLKESDSILDLIGPLGMPSELKKYGNILCVAGGVGIAEIYPVASGLKAENNRLDLITGFQTKDSIILKEQLEEVADSVYITTDDGSFGIKGNVLNVLEELLAKNSYDIIFVAGPIVMMKAVAGMTSKYRIKTIVSLNSIMVDGTGMCGSCRVTVGNKIKFVCVDGPDFDAADVDFDELLLRQNRFASQEKQAVDHGGHRRCHQG